MRKFIYGIKQVIYWLPIIWKNRWWDYGYLLVLMEHQLDYMLAHWVVDTHYMGAKEDKETIQAFRDNIHKLNKNETASWKEEVDLIKLIGEQFKIFPRWWD